MSRIRGVNPATASRVDTHHPAALHPNPRDLGLLMDLYAAPIGAAPIAPGHRVMAGNGARLMKQGAENRRMTAAGHIDRRDAALDEGGVDGFGAHTVVLIDLRPPAHGAHRRIRVREGVMTPRRIEQIQIEIDGEILPQAHALVVEFHPLGSEIVRANDGGVAAGIAAAEIAFVEHRHVADTVIAGQVIGRRQTVAARPDDDHVVTRFQRVVVREHAGLRVLAREAETK